MFDHLRKFLNLPARRQSKIRTSKNPNKRQLSVETLEGRRVLSATTMTDYEQLILELVNRARMDPTAEVARNPAVSSLNQGLNSNTGLISTTPKQPLAAISELVDAGRFHAQDMIDFDYFSHSGRNGSTPSSRAAAFGYWNNVGENISWNGNTGTIDQATETFTAHQNLFASPSHRLNMLHDTYSEAGIGVVFGQFTDGLTYNAAMTAEEFGFRVGDAYITGVAYDDGVTLDDDFYSIGEGLGHVRITAVSMADGTSYSTRTTPSGGYNLAVPDGTYTVTASDGFWRTVVETNVVVDNANVKVDFDSSTAAPERADIIGLNSGEEFWVGESNGTTLQTSFFGQWPTATFTHVDTGDVNGDGLDDMVGRQSDGTLVVGLATGMGNFIVDTWGNFTNVVEWSEFHVGDFNGDGLDDVLARALSDGTFWRASSTGNSFVNSYMGSYPTSVDWTFVVGDFSGDGLTDITGRATDGTWWTGVSNGDRFQNAYWGKWTTRAEWVDIRVGDFNGDGVDDIAGRANNKWWWVGEATGTSFASQYWASWTDVAWQDVLVGDYNADGIDDIAGRGNGQWWVAESNPATKTFSHHYYGFWTTGTTWSDVNVFDLNGDEVDDIIGRAANGQWWVFQSDGSRFSGRLAATWSPGSSWQHVGIGNFN